MTGKDKVIDRLRKLIAVAEDQDGTPEGEIAARMADKLMREEAITRAELSADASEAIKRFDTEVAQSSWRRSLFHRIAQHYQCSTFYVTGTKRFTVLGYADDIDVVRYVYDVVEREIEQAARRYVAAGDLPWYRTVRQAGADFRNSAVRGFSSKLAELRRDGEAEDARGTALVLSRGVKVKAYVEENYNLRTGRRSRARRHNGDGYAAGHAINIHKGVRGSSSKRISEQKRIE